MCPAHLQDKHFCSPIIDTEGQAKRLKEEALAKEIEKIKKEYEEKQRRKKEREKAASKDDKEEKDKGKDEPKDKDKDASESNVNDEKDRDDKVRDFHRKWKPNKMLHERVDWFSLPDRFYPERLWDRDKVRWFTSSFLFAQVCCKYYFPYNDS